tara:strand:+ start:37112 stop:39658 length:2547 start_codon:yes stop_codon:yes gene_type:complete
MKTKLLFVLIFSTFILTAQSNKELADDYLNKRGELAFTFTATTIDEIRQLSRILSFDHGQDQSNPLTIKAIANKNNFDTFLTFNLPFTVDKKLNDPKDVVMFNPKIHKKGVLGKNAAYTLAFPLSTYPTYADYAQQMADFAADHSSIAELVDIGGTVQGVGGGDKRLLFIKLSDNVSTREAEPRVMYTSSMHGDEIAGYPSMLNLIDYFITAYEDVGHSDHARIKNLLDNSEVWINPMANPDATFWNDNTNTSVANSRRANASNVDLNRNYPDNVVGNHPLWVSYELETQNFMALAASTHFVLSANFHGGTEVVNYPWDNTPVRHPDDEWYFLIGKEYAVNCQNDSPNGYMDAMYTDYVWPGVTNGNDWYEVYGGRQDYMNFSEQCKESTIELSNVKVPPATNTASNNEIIDIWNYNQEAYIEFLIQGTYGFQGVVKDAISGNPINAKVTLVGHDALGSWVETELPLGDYYRPVKAGIYDILFEADCYISQTLTNQTITDYQTIVLSDVLLTASGGSSADVPASISENGITYSSATITWADSGANFYEIDYRKQGETTWLTNVVSASEMKLSNLDSNAIYEYQIRSFCGGYSNYSSVNTFTTLEYTVSYCISNGNTTYDTGVTLVSFNAINNADTNNRDNGGYEDFTGLSTNVTQNSSYDLTVNIDSDGGTAQTIVWIDWNIDGDFDDSGETIDLGSDSNLSDQPTASSPYSITIPATAVIGTTRMRVAVRYGTTNPASCNTGYDGEVEDYTVNIIDSTLGIEDELLSGFSLYPNPVTTGEITLRMPNEIQEFKVTISNVMGQKLFTENVNSISRNNHIVKTTDLKTGIYFVTVSTNLGKATKKMIIQ